MSISATKAIPKAPYQSEMIQKQQETCNEIFEINSLNDIKLYLTDLDPATTIVASNIHNTLITYEDPLLCSGVNKLIDDLVAEKIKNEISTDLISETEKGKYTKIYKEKYMSIILLNAKYQLTERTATHSSASIIHELAKRFFVMGFTESKTGPFGIIPNAEVWKTELLKGFDITFPPAINIEKTKRFLDDGIMQNYAILNDGILFVGNKKDEARVFYEFIQQTQFPIKQLVIIDNKRENIEILQKELLKEYNIPVLGLVYNYHNNTPVDPRVAKIQKQTLLEEETWVSFEDALRMDSK